MKDPIPKLFPEFELLRWKSQFFPFSPAWHGAEWAVTRFQRDQTCLRYCPCLGNRPSPRLLTFLARNVLERNAAAIYAARSEHAATLTLCNPVRLVGLQAYLASFSTTKRKEVHPVVVAVVVQSKLAHQWSDLQTEIIIEYGETYRVWNLQRKNLSNV